MKKHIRSLIELIERDRRKQRTKEEALHTLVRAGILDEQGNFTEPYFSDWLEENRRAWKRR